MILIAMTLEITSGAVPRGIGTGEAGLGKPRKAAARRPESG